MNKLLPLGLLAAGIGSQSAFAQSRPNIILFLVDDMGWQETSVPFYSERTLLNDRYRTPAMERLAALGVKFTEAYACAISSPSRASLMSGMNAARHRVTNWTLQYNTKTDASSSVIDLPDWNYNGIQPAATATSHDLANGTPITSLPQLLRDAGYFTIHCGKAHFGAISTQGEDPLTMGFDVNIAGGANGAPGSYLAENEYGSGSFHVSGLEKYYGTGTFLTEALTIEALSAITDHLASAPDQPFYLYMSHYAIHSPYNADTRFTGNYTGVTDPLLGTQLNTNEVNHAALVEGMDKSLGDILDYLEARPDVAQNTIILFMSDNGGQAVGIRQGTANRDQNTPHRAGKGSAYMGGVHEPMLVYWPGVTEGGTVNDNRVMIEDFFPTILEMAGVDSYSTVQTVDGQSFVDILRNPAIERDRVAIWHFPNLWGETQSRDEGYGAYSAIMKGDYHMIYFWETQERRLYNILSDVGEQNDLAEAEPELLQSLAQELTDSLQAYGAQRPSYKVTGQLIPWPSEAVEQPGAGDVVAVSDYIFRRSTETEKFFYRVEDARPATSEGPFFWTLGEHHGARALQCRNTSSVTNGRDLADQLFYFEPGADDKHFRLYTIDGQPIDYVEGLTRDNWNGGNITPTGTYKFMQYDTDTAGEFQLVYSGKLGYYLVRTPDGVLLNDRGTANGSAANMKWVVNTYTNISINDTGSQYIFRPVEGSSVRQLAEHLYAAWTSEGNYVGAHRTDQVADAYAAALEQPSRQALHAMQDAYEAGGTIALETGRVYRLYQPRADEALSADALTLAADGTIQGTVVTSEAYGPADYAALWQFVGSDAEGYRLRSLSADAYLQVSDDASAVSAAADAGSVMAVGQGTTATQWTLNVTGDASLTNTYLNARHYDAPGGNSASHEVGTWRSGASDAGNLWMMEEVAQASLAIGSGGWAAVCLPFAWSVPAGLTAYVARDVTDGSLLVNPLEAEVVPAYSPVLVAGAEGTHALSIVGDDDTPALATGLEGTTLATTLATADVAAYFLDQSATGQPVFVRATATSTPVAAATAYYVAAASAPATLPLLVGTTPVAAAPVVDGQPDAPYHDLAGRRVTRPVKGGFYIHRGQKVIVQ